MAQLRKKKTAPKRNVWQLQEAKARFSEVVRKTLEEGPQRVTRQGHDSVVIVPAEEFDSLLRRSKQPRSLVEFFATSPVAQEKLMFERDQDPGRDIEL